MTTLLIAYFCIGIIFFSYVLWKVEKKEDITPLMLMVILAFSLFWPMSAVVLYSTYRRSLNHGED